MSALAEDEHGNRLLAFTPCAEAALAGLDPLPLALVVVEHDGAALLVHNRRRGEWELPGGVIEPGETPRRAALRELEEETGLAVVEVEHVGAAEFLLDGDQHEYAAVFRHVLSRPVDVVPLDADEVDEVCWWRPGTDLERLAALDGWLAGSVVAQ